MTVAALVRPDIPNQVVEPFRRLRPDLQVRSDLSSAESVDVALIFGGDGTVHRHLPELSRRKIPALVVPVGSGNDFAKAIRIANERVALRAWAQFCASGKNVRSIDLGTIRRGREEILFCCVAGMGLDAESNARANRMPTWLRSRGGYVLAALQSLTTGRAIKMRVRATEIENSTMAWLVAVGNAHRYGGGARIVPLASLDDGLLDVCIVKQMSKFKVLCALPTVFWGGHIRLKQVDYFRTAAVRLESDPELEIYADGEPVCRTPAEFSVHPRAFNVIVPA
jgi:diacylglycerol kinase (ATP)